jgi:hypothetical protein
MLASDDIMGFKGTHKLNDDNIINVAYAILTTFLSILNMIFTETV